MKYTASCGYVMARLLNLFHTTTPPLQTELIGQVSLSKLLISCFLYMRKGPKWTFFKCFYLQCFILSRSTTKRPWCHPGKTQISLGICSLVSLCCLYEEVLGLYLLIKRKAKTDQTVQMPRLIRVFAGPKSFCWFCHAEAHFTISSKLIILFGEIKKRRMLYFFFLFSPASGR